MLFRHTDTQLLCLACGILVALGCLWLCCSAAQPFSVSKNGNDKKGQFPLLIKKSGVSFLSGGVIRIPDLHLLGALHSRFVSTPKLASTMFFHRVPHYQGTGKVVVLSGCDHGIGNAAAKRLGLLGYTVIAGCLTDEGARKLQEEGIGIRAEKCDVTKTEDVSRLVSVVEGEYSGKLHALVNNAGINANGPALIVPLETSEKVVAVNLLGTMRMTKMFLPLLVGNAGSRIVFVSSIGGLCPMWGGSSYCASKFGIEGYARVLRDELHVFDVQVSIINPGLTETSMIKSSMQLVRKNFEACSAETKKLFGLDYADRCCEFKEKSMQRTAMDNVSAPTDCICKAVGSIKCGDRYYSGLMANTIFRLAAIFPPLCRFLSRYIAVLPAPEKK